MNRKSVGSENLHSMGFMIFKAMIASKTMTHDQKPTFAAMGGVTPHLTMSLANHFGSGMSYLNEVMDSMIFSIVDLVA